MSLAVKRALYRHGWDTRSRNLLPVHLLRPILGRAIDQCQNLLLDVGCGGFGLASFLPDVSVVGVDLETPSETVSNLKFRVGSVTSLPFPDRSFLVVSCIDVLEHLPEAERERAVRELVRVASETILIACPHGVIARRCDNEYRRASLKHGRPVPEWVEEHLRQTYPEHTAVAESVQRAARATGRSAKVTLSFCEPANVSRLIRSAAARSELLYFCANLLLGIISPLLPSPAADKSYRMVLLAELSS